MESGGRLGKRAMGVLNQLATIGAESDGVDVHAAHAASAACVACHRQRMDVETCIAGHGPGQRALLPSRPGAAHR